MSAQVSKQVSGERLAAFLDGELSGAARTEVDGLLAGDPALRARLESWSAQDCSLREAFAPELAQRVPTRLLAATLRTAEDAARPRRREPSWRERIAAWMPRLGLGLGYAATLLLGVLLGRELLPGLDVDRQLVRLAAVAHHVYSPDKRQPVEVKGDDPTLMSWLSKRLGAQVQAPALADSGWRFMGGRLLAGAEEPASQLMYEDTAGKRLTVFVRREGAAGRETTAECGDYRAVNVCYWYAGGLAYALAAELPRNDLAPLARAAAASLAKPAPR